MLKQQILDLLIPLQKHLGLKPNQTFDWHDPETDPKRFEFLEWYQLYWDMKIDLEEFLAAHCRNCDKSYPTWDFWTEDYIDELIIKGELY